MKLRHIISLLGLILLLAVPFMDVRSQAGLVRASADLSCSFARVAPVDVLLRFAANMTGWKFALSEPSNFAGCDSVAKSAARTETNYRRVIPREDADWWQRLTNGPSDTLRDFLDAWVAYQHGLTTTGVMLWVLGAYLAAALLLLLKLPDWSELEADWWGGYVRTATWFVPVVGGLALMALNYAFRTTASLLPPAGAGIVWSVIVAAIWFGVCRLDHRRGERG